MVSPFTDSGESTVEPSLTQKEGESIVEQYAAVVVNDLWLFDQTTGRILAKAVAQILNLRLWKLCRPRRGDRHSCRSTKTNSG